MKNARGFTIVELLIVIVVIGILAAIVIVAFNGVKDRAKWSSAQSNLLAINKAILRYQAENGSYPSTGAAPSWVWRYSCTNGVAGDSFIPTITAIMPNVPQAPCSGTTGSDDTWLYGSDGVEYKLLHIRPAFSDAIKNGIPVQLRDNRWSSNGSWGYWSAGAATR